MNEQRSDEYNVLAVCKAFGYGRVMQIAADEWAKKDPIGALTVGPCAGSPSVAILEADLAEAKRLLRARCRGCVEDHPYFPSDGRSLIPAHHRKEKGMPWTSCRLTPEERAFLNPPAVMGEEEGTAVG